MAAKIIKELYGFSGNQIYLMQKHDRLFVRKIGNVERNMEQMKVLANDYPVPKIYGTIKNWLDIEYIHGLDIKTYLKTHNHEHLLNFLIEVLDKFSQNSIDKDYSEVYKKKLNEVDFSEIPFTAQELFDKLPKKFPCSEYHGDLTLENIIYSEDRGFFLIDCSSGEYDSYIFDIAKLRQDLECGWFLRKDNVKIDIKIKLLQKALLERYPLANNDYLLILMLLRVYRHAKPNTFEKTFLLEGIKKLWK